METKDLLVVSKNKGLAEDIALFLIQTREAFKAGTISSDACARLTAKGWALSRKHRVHARTKAAFFAMVVRC